MVEQYSSKCAYTKVHRWMRLHTKRNGERWLSQPWARALAVSKGLVSSVFK